MLPCRSCRKTGRWTGGTALVVPPVRLALRQALAFGGCLLALIVTLSNIAPLLQHRLSHLPWVHLRADAHLLGDIKADFNLLQLGRKLGDVLAGGLGVEVARLLWFVSNHCLASLKTLLWTFLETTACRATKFHRDLKKDEMFMLYHTLLHFVSGENLVVCCLERAHSSRGQLEHLVFVV